MNKIIFGIGIICTIIGSAATPFAIGVFIYEYAIHDMHLKYALWEGFKVWASMLSLILVGLPCIVLSEDS